MTDKPFNTLDALQGLKLKKLKKEAKAREEALARDKAAKLAKAEAEAAKARKVEDRVDEEDAFFTAMSGVAPIKGSGRAVAPEKPREARAPVVTDDDGVSTLKGLVDGSIEFELEYTDEFLEGHVRGLDQVMVRKLKSGTFSVEAHLDLHGQTIEQAFDAVLFFLRESYLMGRRCVLLIPGRGRNSPGGIGLIKSEVQNWLTREPMKRVILAFATAQPKHGGAGALYVLLRKRKHEGGKVAFDRTGFWEE